MACQPRDAKRVRKSLFARHSIPVAYPRWDDWRPIHSTKIIVLLSPPRQLRNGWSLAGSYRSRRPPQEIIPSGEKILVAIKTPAMSTYVASNNS